ncbi:MAG: hypothetical protein QM817_40990 [Archangium sp.]
MFWLWLLLAALDGGATPDAGTLDGGVVDAGPVAPPRWQWTHDGGWWLNDAGLTDVLTMRVGETAEVKLPHPIILMQCDVPLVTLGATQDTLLLTAVQKGDTHCGFWFKKNSWPDRSMELHVGAK